MLHAHRYWQCLPSSGPAPAPAPRSTSGRRLLQASEAPTPSRLGPLPEPYTGGKRQTNPAGRNHTKVPDYGQCGGTETCPLVSSFCTDSQYLPCAIKTSQCIRMSATFWVRQTGPSACAANLKDKLNLCVCLACHKERNTGCLSPSFYSSSERY